MSHLTQLPLLRGFRNDSRRVAAGDGADEERQLAGQHQRRFRLRGGDDSLAVVCVGCIAVLVLFRVLFFGVVVPNEYAIKQNTVTGTVHRDWQRGKLVFTGPFVNLIKFPATQTTLEFSRHSDDRPPIQTRTGADPSDPDSGGQPLALTVSIQYRFVPDRLKDVYLAFGSYEAAKQRYLLLAGNMVSNAAQEWTPQDFWERRNAIAKRMLENVNNTLWEQGKVIAVRLQIMKVDFAEKFEDSITQVQVAEQQKVVNEYRQQVAQVDQSIAVLRSINLANIANISAAADATSKEICAAAKRDAFNMKQGTKARKYAELQKKLGFGPAHMTKYLKIKALQGQATEGKVIVGMPAVQSSKGA